MMGVYVHSDASKNLAKHRYDIWRITINQKPESDYEYD